MESKIIKITNYLLLLVGTALSIYTNLKFLFEPGSFLSLDVKYKYLLLLFNILVFCVLIYIVIKFKTYIDSFHVLYSMARNNKLHTLRALVFVTYHNIINRKNCFIVRNGKFSYYITKDENSDNIFNVKYLLELYITIDFFKKIFLNENKTSLYQIFAIIENNYEIIKHTIRISLSKQSEIFNLDIPLNAITLSKFDRNLRFAGLGAIESTLPNRMLKMSDNTNPVKFICQYTVKNQIELKSNKRNYDFVIIPRNYGKRMKALNINLFVDYLLEIIVEIQEISRLGNELIYKSIDVMIKKSNKPQNGLFEYVLHSDKIIPNMNSIYFIKVQFLKKEEKNE